VRSTRFLILTACTLALGCGSDPGEDAATGGAAGFSTGGASTGSVPATGALPATGATGASAGTGGAAPSTGGATLTGGMGPGTGGAGTGGLAPGTGGTGTGGSSPSTGGSPPATGGAPTGGFAPLTGGAPTGGAATGGANPETGGVPPGGAPTGGTDSGSGGAGGAPADCPHSGSITYTLNRSDSPTADELDAYERITAAMDEAVYYYNCYADLDKHLTANYNPGVPTAEANIDGWMSFGTDRAYMVLPTAMHEIAHTLGVGYYGFGDMTDSNGIWTGANANAVIASIENPRDTQLHADSMHFWPYGLNYASEYENEDDLINHVRIVAAIRLDLGR
jgi:hypothetical protein